MAGRNESALAVGTPAGLDGSFEVFARAARLAEALFAPAWAHVTLIVDGQVWRSNDPHARRGSKGLVANIVSETREVLWVADAREDERFREMPLVTGEPGVRCIAGAPIRLDDGSCPGALVVGSPQTRPYDAELANRLQDLADFVAEEWRRVQARRAEEASSRDSQASRQLLKSIIESAPLSLVMLDRELRILAASRAWLDSRRLVPDETIGRPLEAVMPQASEWMPTLDRCLAGEAIKSDRGAVLTPDGDVSWWRSELTPWRDSAGEVGGILVSAHEITDMVEALDAAQRSEERLKAALEIAQVHVWDMDFATRRLAKVGDETIFFETQTTFDSLEDWGIADPRDVPAMKAAWKAHEKEGAPYRPIFRARRGDGKEVWAMGSARLVRDEQGRPLRMIGAMQDVTDRKLAEDALRQAKEEAEAATRAKSAFLATMSHEIRTPLNGVLGMAQAMAADELASRQRERLDVIHQSGEALLAVLNDVLDLSKIEAGKLELEDAEFEIEEIARGAQATFAATAQSKGLDFGLSVSPKARGAYRGDPVRVRQILFNLVSNALKFTERGRVAISVDRRDGRLRLTVSDTGIGIAPEKVEALFQKFEQADASTTRRYGGTGLGLAICRDLAEMMGGRISASSTEGEGTSFLVELPLKKLGKTARSAAAADSAPVLADPGLRVLAAEDNRVNQLVLQTLLAQIGVEPVIVPDGRAAVAAWEKEPWDLILMDVQMPDMDGPTATAIIRAREAAEGRERTRIVALTANAMDHQVAEYRASGMDGFVAKPVEAARLFQAVLEAQALAEARAAA